MGRSSRGCVATLWLLAACQVWCISAQTLNTGNLAVSWDVVKSSTQEYTVVVRLRNNQLINPIPAPGWSLGWTWMMSEMVESVDGAQVLNLADCSGTDAALDFPNEVQYAVTCAPRPIFVSTVNQGYLPATSVDAVNNTAQFTITMGKGSLFWGIGNLTLPTNFDVGLPGYQCTLPAPVAAGRSVPVSMTGRQYYTAISSYDFTCAPTAQYAAKPKCCVSFSGFFNNTVATCPSCACGCNATLGSNASSCPATWQSGPNAATQLVLGPAVRTTAPLASNSKQTLDASPLSCGSGCQTDIHFAISEEYEGGWKVQVAIANTGSLPINNWLLAMDLPLINYLGSVFSVNYATSKQLPTVAIFSGQPYFNEVINASPGNMQWIMLFNKTAVTQASSLSSAPVVKVVDQNAFPTSVYFMGQQCSMPPLRAIPSNLAGQTSGAIEGVRLSFGLLLGVLALAFVL